MRNTYYYTYQYISTTGTRYNTWTVRIKLGALGTSYSLWLSYSRYRALAQLAVSYCHPSLSRYTRYCFLALSTSSAGRARLLVTSAPPVQCTNSFMNYLFCSFLDLPCTTASPSLPLSSIPRTRCSSFYGLANAFYFLSLFVLPRCIYFALGPSAAHSCVFCCVMTPPRCFFGGGGLVICPLSCGAGLRLRSSFFGEFLFPARLLETRQQLRCLWPGADIGSFRPLLYFSFPYNSPFTEKRNEEFLTQTGWSTININTTVARKDNRPPDTEPSLQQLRSLAEIMRVVVPLESVWFNWSRAWGWLDDEKYYLYTSI